MSAGSRIGSGEGSQPGPDVVALTRSPGFWRLMGYAALFGVVLAFASLAFLGLVDRGTNLWFTLPNNPGWLDGSLWWVAAAASFVLAASFPRWLQMMSRAKSRASWMWFKCAIVAVVFDLGRAAALVARASHTSRGGSSQVVRGASKS